MIAADTLFIIIIIYAISSPLACWQMWKNNEEVSIADLLLAIFLAPIVFLPVLFMWVHDIKLKSPKVPSSIPTNQATSKSKKVVINPRTGGKTSQYLIKLRKELEKHTK